MLKESNVKTLKLNNFYGDVMDRLQANNLEVAKVEVFFRVTNNEPFVHIQLKEENSEFTKKVTNCLGIVNPIDVESDFLIIDGDELRDILISLYNVEPLEFIKVDEEYYMVYKEN